MPEVGQVEVLIVLIVTGIIVFALVQRGVQKELKQDEEHRRRLREARMRDEGQEISDKNQDSRDNKQENNE